MQLRIKEIRKRQRLSQQEVVTKVKRLNPGTLIDQSTLSRYENSDYEIRFSTLCLIAKALNVPVTMLFDTSEPSSSAIDHEEPVHAGH